MEKISLPAKPMFISLPQTSPCFYVSALGVFKTLSEKKISYLDAIETLIFRREMSLIATSFGFAQHTIHDFQNTVLNL